MRIRWITAAFGLACAACSAVVGGVLLVRASHSQPSRPQISRALIEQGRYEDAERALRSRVASLEATYGPASPQVDDAAVALAHVLRLNGKAMRAETLAMAQHAYERQRARFGSADPSSVDTLVTLGQVLADRGEFTPALAHLRQALAIREARSGRDSQDTAAVLDVLGATLTQARAYNDALATLQRSLRIKEGLRSVDGASLAQTLETITAAYQGNGEYGAARASLNRAIETETGRSPMSPLSIATLNLEALQLWFEGSWLESRDTSLRAVRLAESTLRPDHPLLARTLRILAATVAGLGDMATARAYAARALEIAQRSLGPANYELAAYLNDLADINLTTGAFADARAEFEQALRIAEATVSPNHEYIPNLLHNLALVDARLGDLTSARREHARAMELWERALGPDHPFVAVALTQLAGVLREQGAPGEALPLLERALTIRERALGSTHRDTARTLVDIAVTLSVLDQNDRAQSIAARALRIWEHTDTKDAPELGIVLALYARLQLSRGALAEATRYFERALTIDRKVLGPNHPLVADAQVGLATALARSGRDADAIRNAVSAEAVGRQHLRLMLRHLPERQSLSYAASRPKGLDLILSLAGDSAPADGALDELIRSRALVLDEMAARRHAAVTSDENLAPLRMKLLSAQQRLVNLVVRGPDGQSPEQYLGLVDDARRGKEEAERDLAERSAAFRTELGQAQSGLREVRRAIPPDAAVVSYVRFDRAPGVGVSRADASRSRLGPARASYLAFVVRADAPTATVRLGDAAAIDTLVARWRSEIAAGATTDQDRSARAVRAAGLRLRNAVWDPIAGDLAGVKRIFVVPDGSLNVVPFVALPGTHTEFLIEEAPGLHYLSAERDLLAAPFAASSAGADRGLLAVGGPAFDDDTAASSASGHGPGTPNGTRGLRTGGSTCRPFESLRFTPLAGTLQEVQQIANIWTGPDGPRAEDVRLLVGREADEGTFKREAARYRVLHLATHGFFLGGPCHDAGDAGLRSVGGIVAHTNGIPMTTSAAIGVSESPLLFSGLALAGANRRASAGVDDEDGILTAEEVAGLNLERVEWAVLSACDTGVGEIKASEGVFGLRRAFQVAGARTVIMSLWAVEDQATRVWMGELYKARFKMHLSTVDAMRAASLTVLQTRRARHQSTHPLYWAAFVAAGDWR